METTVPVGAPSVAAAAAATMPETVFSYRTHHCTWKMQIGAGAWQRRCRPSRMLAQHLRPSGEVSSANAQRSPCRGLTDRPTRPPPILWLADRGVGYEQYEECGAPPPFVQATEGFASGGHCDLLDGGRNAAPPTSHPPTHHPTRRPTPPTVTLATHRSHASFVRLHTRGGVPEWWFLFGEHGLAIHLRDDPDVSATYLSWDGRALRHCTAVPTGVQDGDRLLSLFTTVQSKAISLQERLEEFKAAERQCQLREPPMAVVGDGVWVRWVQNDDTAWATTGRSRHPPRTARHHPAPPHTAPRRPGTDRNWRRRDGVVTAVEGGQFAVGFADKGHSAHTYPLADWGVAVLPAGYVGTPTLASQDLLTGQRVRVWWPGEAAFFSGTVQSYHRHRNEHTVLYDDGDRITERLGDEENAPHYYIL